MKKCRITVMKKAFYPELAARYENPIDHACELREGQVFITDGWRRPEGMCESAWGSLSPFVMTLAHGGGNFYDGWMQNEKSAMIRGGSDACNVLPQNMEAAVNFRIACGHTAGEVFARCRAAVGDRGIALRFLQANDPSAVARTDGLGYERLTAALGRYFGPVVYVPTLSVGATDARRYEQICDACLRCSPFVGSREEVARGVHGTDEKLAVRAYAQGIRVLIALLTDTCL